MIYLDHAATTPISEFALSEMSRAAREQWGHPSSLHTAGRRARAALNQALDRVAGYLGCDVDELVLATSATQALVWALDRLTPSVDGPVVCSRVEHPALVDHLSARMDLRARLCWSERPAGAAPSDELSNAGLVAIADLNHELGTVVPPSVRSLSPSSCVWLIDAAQSAAWIDLRPWFDASTVVVVSSAKLGGPPGVAVMRVPPELRALLVPHDELSIAPGTVPWLAAIGMGAACAARQGRRDEQLHVARQLARRLLAGLRTLEPELIHNGDPEIWLGPILNVGWRGREGHEVEHALDLHGVAIARGSACQSRRTGGSRVIAAAYPGNPERARAATRWSLSWTTTESDIEVTIDRVVSLFDQHA